MGISLQELVDAMNLPPADVASGVGLTVADLADFAYEKFLKDEWKHQLNNSPHGYPWHTSFHASEFPADWDKACGRKALYGLMNIPETEPLPAFVAPIGEVGKAIEEGIVNVWKYVNILVSPPPGSMNQWGFKLPEAWLTGACDAVIVPPKWKRLLPVEIKGKNQTDVFAMKSGVVKFGDYDYHEEHKRQLMCYVGLARLSQPFIWPSYEPPDQGSLLYVSREKPGTRHEYRFDYDHSVFMEGYDKLVSWREHFIDGTLPQRPKEWRWTEAPCDWCGVKKLCKADVKAEVTSLSASKAVTFAKELNPKYDYKAIRAAVFERWKESDASSSGS